MPFEQLEFRSGVLGQGCYINRYLSRPNLLRFRLPASIVLRLMDFGRWQMLSQSDDIFVPEELRAQKQRLLSLNEKILDLRRSLTQGLGALQNRQRPLSNHNKESASQQSDHSSLGLMPLNTIIECYWHADRRAIERAALRLQHSEQDVFTIRLSRILMSINGAEHASGEPQA